MKRRSSLTQGGRVWSKISPLFVMMIAILVLNLGSAPLAQASNPSTPETASEAPAVQPDAPRGAASQAATSQAATSQASDIQLEDRVFEISRKLRCPVCISESVADSNAQIAQEMRQLIQSNLESGMNEKQILAYFQGRYGDWILLDPPKRGLHLVVWLLPIAAALGGVVFLAFKIREWRAAADAPISVEPDDLERVREAMKGDTR